MPESNPAETGAPPTQNSTPDLIDQTLREAEIKKLLAEAEKLQAEADGARQTWKKLWQRPAAWAALLPGFAAIATGWYAYSNGLLDARQTLLEAKRTELQSQIDAQTRLLEAQKIKLEGTFDAEKTLQTAQRERLTAQNELLERDQNDFKTKKADFEKEKDKLAKEKDRLEKQLAALQLQVKQAALKVPLDSLLADENAAANFSNANYGTLLQAVKRDPTDDNRNIVLEAVGRAKTEPVKALLYRVLYIGTGERRFVDELAPIIDSYWAKADELFWYMFYPVEPFKWPAEGKALLFDQLTNILSHAVKDGKVDTALSISAALSVLCPEPCRTVDRALEAATLARTALLAVNGRDFDRTNLSMLFLFGLNPFAGQLIFAHQWSSAGPLDNKFGGSAKSFLLPGPNLDQPASTMRVDWMAWLERHEKDLNVLSEVASKWPDGKGPPMVPAR